MSFKDLGNRDIPPRVESPEDAELRARAAARHRAKEAKAAKWEEHRAAKKGPDSGGAARREPPK
jgi:hypothetical protein